MFKLRVKLFSVALVVSLSIFLGAGLCFAQPSDIQGHWAEQQISNWVDKGLASGYQDGAFKPDNSITRAEFITLVNKSFGFSGSAQIGFSDVSSTDWFFEQVSRAMAAGYISGYEDGTLRPDDEISRQEVAVILSRLLKLKVTENIDSIKKFKDAGDIPQWSKGAVNAVVAGQYMSGYPDQTYQPEVAITRAEAIVTLDRATAVSAKNTTFDKAGVFGPEQGMNTFSGDVVISSAGVTLQNSIINGNLLIAEGVGEGNVRLKNVTVKGSTTIKGGGTHSVTLEDCTLATVTVSKEGGNIRVVVSGSTSASAVTLQSGARLEESGLTGNGFGSITVSGTFPANTTIVLVGAFQSVNLQAPNIHIQLESGSVAGFNVAEEAAGATISVAGAAQVTTLTLNAAATVTGQGTVENAQINTNGVTIEQVPKNVDLANGVTATVNAKVVTQSTTNQTTGVIGGGAGGAAGGAPKITAATVSVGGNVQNVAISNNGLNGNVNLSGLAKALPITGGTITVSKASTLTLSVLSIPVTQQLSEGSNQLDVFNVLSQFGKNGINLGQLEQILGSPVTLSGTLKDSNNISSDVSITIALP